MEKIGDLIQQHRSQLTSQKKPTRIAKNATGQVTTPEIEKSAPVLNEPWPKGPIDDRPGVHRWAMRGLRKRGLRNLAKYPLEAWEEPLTAEERQKWGME
jgi:hypothetical protein